MKNLAITLIFPVLVFLTGCSSIYRTPGAESLTISELAILEHDPIASGVVINDVDGKWRGIGNKQRYELTPGEHSITVAVNRYGYTGGKITRWFKVRAGSVYKIEAVVDTKTMQWGVVVLDKITGKRADQTRPVGQQGVERHAP